MQIHVSEIAEDTFCISLRPAGSFISFNSFVIRDSAPALIHTGHNKTFDIVKEQVARLIDPSSIKYICFSHYEPDECGSLNKWLELAPHAVACVNKICDSSLKDDAIRPSHVLKDGDIVNLGLHELLFLETPHFPHAWEAALFLDTKTKTLFSSDLGTQQGFPQVKDEAVDVEDVIMLQERLGYMPYGPHLTNGIKRVRELDIHIMATMHGNSLNASKSRELLELLEKKNQLAMNSSNIATSSFTLSSLA